MKEKNAVCRDHSDCEGCEICRKYLSAVSVNEEQLNRYRELFRRSYENYIEQVKTINVRG